MHHDRFGVLDEDNPTLNVCVPTPVAVTVKPKLCAVVPASVSFVAYTATAVAKTMSHSHFHTSES